MDINLQIPVYIELSSFFPSPSFVEEPQTKEDLELLDYPLLSNKRHYLLINAPSTDNNLYILSNRNKSDKINVSPHPNFTNIIRTVLSPSVGYGINPCYLVELWEWEKVFNPSNTAVVLTNLSKLKKTKIREEYWRISLPYNMRGVSDYYSTGLDNEIYNYNYHISSYAEIRNIQDTASHIYFSLANNSPLRKLFNYSPLLGYLAYSELAIEESPSSPGISKLKVSNAAFSLKNPQLNIDNTIHFDIRTTKLCDVKELYIGVPPSDPLYSGYTPPSPYLLKGELDVINPLMIVDYEGNIYLPGLDFNLVDTVSNWKPPLPERYTEDTLPPEGELTPLYQIEWISSAPSAYRIDYIRPLTRKEIVNREMQRDVTPFNNCCLGFKTNYYST